MSRNHTRAKENTENKGLGDTSTNWWEFNLKFQQKPFIFSHTSFLSPNWPNLMLHNQVYPVGNTEDRKIDYCSFKWSEEGRSPRTTVENFGEVALKLK